MKNHEKHETSKITKVLKKPIKCKKLHTYDIFYKLWNLHVIGKQIYMFNLDISSQEFLLVN